MRLAFLFLTLIIDLSYSQIVFNSTKIILKENKLIRTTENVLEITDKGKSNLGEIYLSHKDDDNFKILNAEIIDKNGRVVYKLKNKDISVRNEFSKYTFHNDYLVSELNLFWDTYPYTIKYSYQSSSKEFISIANWNPLLYNYNTPETSIVKIDLPIDYPFNLNYTKDLEFNEYQSKGRHILEWKLNKKQIGDSEFSSPSIYDLMPSIKLVPINFNYGVEGNQSSWMNFGDWFLKLNENNTTLTEREKIKINSVLNGKNNKKEIVTSLYKYLQDNTKYVNVSIDLGGLKSYPASYVCENKYGDCKALTTYMKGLLEYAEIKSNYVLINSGNNASKVDTTIPSNQFNHVILGVDIGDEILFLDNTSRISTVDYLETSNQNRKALWVDENTSHIFEMPKMSKEDVFYSTKLNISLDEQGNGDYTMTKKVKARPFEKYAYFNFNSDNESIKSSIIDYTPLNYFDQEKWNLDQSQKEENTIIINSNGTIKKHVKEIGANKLIKPPHLNIAEYVNSDRRKTNLQFNKPINNELEVTYQLSNFKDYFLVKPSEFFIENKFGSYSLTVVENDNSVQLNQTFFIKEGNYSLEEYEDFFNFIDSIKKNQKKTVLVLKK